jgi:cell fate regulator YaaT (PSP1 superfamily)
MMHGYGYPAAMPSVHPYTHAMPPAVYGCEPRHRRGGRGRHQQQQQQQQQSPPSVSPTAAGDPPAPSPALQQTNPAPGKPKNAKGKLQNVSDNKSQSRQAGMKKSTSAGVASSALQTDGKATARNESAGCTTPMPSVTARGTKELAKEHDEARFHANRTAPIQLFVVVKRRMEGQRYACPLPPEEVPVGSRMLVEGDRGADLGEVLAHVSVEQMARDCAVVERRRKAALEKMRVQKSSGAAAITAAAALSREENSGAEAACDEAGLPQLTRQEALNYVLSLRDWPWLIGPATIQDVESLGPQREAEKQAFATAKTIVQQFIENRYQQRVARNEQALHAAASPDAAEHKEEEEKAEENASVAAAANEKHAEDASSDDGERRTSLIPLTAEELQTLELSRQVTLVDCEYQFTREKITLFVSRPSRNIFVDFRRMQRKLYRTFRCRIWIAYMDEIADDEDAPESFVFVPPPSSSTAATGTLPGATEDDRQKDA